MLLPFASSAGITVTVDFAVYHIQAGLARKVLEVLYASVRKRDMQEGPRWSREQKSEYKI